MKRNFKLVAPALVLSILFAVSCKSYSEKQMNLETASRGDIKIAVDESFQLIADTEITVFEGMNKNAKITAINASEDSILKLFMNDSVRLMITSRKLSANEEAYLKNNSIIPRTTQIAWDAIAFVVNQSNPDYFIRYNTIKDIFSGNCKTWKEVNPKSKLGDLKVVFDNQGSGNVRTIMNKFKISSLPDYCYAANSNPAVIDFVEKNPGALGIISVNWVSDRDDSITHAFLSKVKVVAVTPEYFSEGEEYFQPHPGYIADKSYPFVREVYAICRETFIGLGRGFIQFVSGEQGQLIILKAGMVPATMPVRVVQISKE